MASYFVVATNGNGLYTREITEYSTTIYCDKQVAEFDTIAEAVAFIEKNDQFFYED